MALVSKWIPGAGKYAPLLAAYRGSRQVPLLLLMYLPGNLLYALAWQAAGFAAGRSLIDHSRSVTVVIAALCLAVFIIAGRTAGRAVERLEPVTDENAKEES